MNGKGSAPRPLDMRRYHANYDRIFGSVRVQDNATHWDGCHRVHPECRRRLEDSARRDDEDAQDETLNAGSLA